MENNSKSLPKKVTSLKVRRRFIPIAPDKVRLVLKLCKNKGVEEAIDIVQNINKSSSKAILSVLKNGQDQLKDRDFQNPYISEVIVNEGPKLKRRRIIHRGRATAIMKRASHIILVISEKPKEEKSTITQGSKETKRSHRGS